MKTIYIILFCLASFKAHSQTDTLKQYTYMHIDSAAIDKYGVITVWGILNGRAIIKRTKSGVSSVELRYWLADSLAHTETFYLKPEKE